MRETLVVSDVHLGVLRSGGTTPNSAMELRKYLQESLYLLLMQHTDKNCLFNGDVFDTFSSPLSDVMVFYTTAAEWLERSNGNLILGRGNHDIPKDNSKMSSFDFVGAILKARFPERVQVVTEPAMVLPGVWQVPHMPNQDLFNLELERIPDDASLVLVHANYDNNFAVEADHSLNVSVEQARKITSNGATLLFGHEHQKRIMLGGKVYIAGNQWPSSVADCQHNPDNKKFAHIIGEDFQITPVLTWDGHDGWGEVDWDNLATGADNDTPFVRVGGHATAEQAPEAIKAIAEFRKRSSAFVVSNAVKVAGMKDMEQIETSVEEIRQFDVLAYLLEQLDPEQAAVVKELLESDEPIREAA